MDLPLNPASGFAEASDASSDDDTASSNGKNELTYLLSKSQRFLTGIRQSESYQASQASHDTVVELLGRGNEPQPQTFTEVDWQSAFRSQQDLLNQARSKLPKRFWKGRDLTIWIFPKNVKAEASSTNGEHESSVEGDGTASPEAQSCAKSLADMFAENQGELDRMLTAVEPWIAKLQVDERRVRELDTKIGDEVAEQGDWDLRLSQFSESQDRFKRLMSERDSILGKYLKNDSDK